MGVVLREETVWVTDLCVRVSDFESFRLSKWSSEWVSEWMSEWVSEFERAERSLSEWECFSVWTLSVWVRVCEPFESGSGFGLWCADFEF